MYGSMACNWDVWLVDLRIQPKFLGRATEVQLGVVLFRLRNPVLRIRVVEVRRNFH